MASVPIAHSNISLPYDNSDVFYGLGIGKRTFVKPSDSSLTWKNVDHRSFYETAKRIFDVLFSGVVLVLSLPIMLVVAIVIIIESNGPVFFRQIRIGRNRRNIRNMNGHLHERRKFDLGGKPFIIYKFRTMRDTVDAYTFRPKQSDDFRLTKAGKVLRRLCLDELPQLWNVLKGDMSLVGPRPELPNIVQQYGEKECVRLTVKPGLTGLWQLWGSRNLMIHENLQYDIEYLRRRSLSFDFKILLRTIPFILGLNNL